MSELYGILQSDSRDQYVWSQYIKWRHMLDGGSIEIWPPFPWWPCTAVIPNMGQASRLL